MWNGHARGISKRCYKGNALPTIGIVLIAAGLILLFACIPGWAWAALAGLLLIVVGYALIRLEAGR